MLRSILRYGVPLLALVLIVGYTLSLVFLVPRYGFDSRWSPDGEMEIRRVHVDRATTPLLQSGDRVLSINGRAIYRTVPHLLFPLQADTFTYEVLREGERLTVSVPNELPPPVWEIDRLATGIAALGTWAVGALLFLLAPWGRRLAWWVGSVLLVVAVVLALSEAALYGIPGAWLLSEPWLPLVAVAYAHLALLPRQRPLRDWSRRLLLGAYTLAGLLALVTLMEGGWLYPRGASLFGLFGLNWPDVMLAATGLALLAHPLLLIIRVRRQPSAYQRRSVTILLVSTLLAIIPLTLLTILPRVLIDRPILPWPVAFGLLCLSPLGYGYVLLRRDYLGLDRLVSRGLTWTLLGLLFVLVFFGTQIGLTGAGLSGPSAETTSLLAAGSGFVLVAMLAQRVERRSHQLVFGPTDHYSQVVTQHAERLVSSPAWQTFGPILADLLRRLDMGQGALLIDQGQGIWSVAAQRGGEDELRIEAVKTGVYPAWVDLAVPLQSREGALGVLLLGPKREGYLTSVDRQFITQMAALFSVTASGIHLLEASRTMSRTLLQAGTVERMALASALHDDPLQRISHVITSLSQTQHQIKQSHLCSDLHVCLDENLRHLIQVNQQVRAICHRLHQPVLDQGLGIALAELAIETERKGELVVDEEICLPPTLLLPPTVVHGVYHLVCEALTNVVKHAQATHVRLVATLEGSTLVVVVEDDGIGMSGGSTATPFFRLLRQHHFGLAGMHEWSRILLGELSVESAPGQGSTLCLRIPLAPHGWSSLIPSGPKGQVEGVQAEVPFPSP